jgi:hypothetical protein
VTSAAAWAPPHYHIYRSTSSCFREAQRLICTQFLHCCSSAPRSNMEEQPEHESEPRPARQDPWAHEARTGLGWVRLHTRLTRLFYLRRVWSHLGSHLKQYKNLKDHQSGRNGCQLVFHIFVVKVNRLFAVANQCGVPGVSEQDARGVEAGSRGIKCKHAIRPRLVGLGTLRRTFFSCCPHVLPCVVFSLSEKLVEYCVTQACE